jgi:hypothetical protein
MTAAQKKARDNFKKAIAYRKKTGCSLKEAFAHVKGGKVAAIPKKKAAKKVGATMFIEKGESKTKRPTKVVQVKRSSKGTFEKFKTVGAFEGDILKKIQENQNNIFKFYGYIDDYTRAKKQMQLQKNKVAVLQYNSDIKRLKKYIAELKKHKTELKKLI